MSAIRRDQIMNLPLEERLKLVDDLWESIRANPDNVPLPDSHREELDRRLAAYRKDSQVTDIAEVVESIRKSP